MQSKNLVYLKLCVLVFQQKNNLVKSQSVAVLYIKCVDSVRQEIEYFVRLHVSRQKKLSSSGQLILSLLLPEIEYKQYQVSFMGTHFFY